MASSASSAPGTDGGAGEGRHRSQLIQALTTAGGLALAGWLAFVARAVDEARQIGGSSPLGGTWERRIEALSFVVFPQHVIVLGPAVAAAAVAGVLAGPLLDPDPLFGARRAATVSTPTGFLIELLEA